MISDHYDVDSEWELSDYNDVGDIFINTEVNDASKNNDASYNNDVTGNNNDASCNNICFNIEDKNGGDGGGVRVLYTNARSIVNKISENKCVIL